MDLLFVDDAIVAVDKPSGLLVHRGWGTDDDVALFRVRDLVGARVYPVHRLDRGTSGVLVFARTPEAAGMLGKTFAGHRVEKRYLALVRGFPPDSGVIDHPVPSSEGGPRVPALTRFTLVARSPVDRCSLLLAATATGRFHQVRRHLKHISHPVVGDVNYGSGEINRHHRARHGLRRLALHALAVRLPHPATGAPLQIVAPVPDDLGLALQRLGLPRDIAPRFEG
ncbi:MAG TPA: pseudouridine synthase [Polyangia bacterium]|nr:pseudouridine synthase [Polyangia bacterium]